VADCEEKKKIIGTRKKRDMKKEQPTQEAYRNYH